MLFSPTILTLYDALWTQFSPHPPAHSRSENALFARQFTRQLRLKFRQKCPCALRALLEQRCSDPNSGADTPGDIAYWNWMDRVCEPVHYKSGSKLIFWWSTPLLNNLLVYLHDYMEFESWTETKMSPKTMEKMSWISDMTRHVVGKFPSRESTNFTDWETAHVPMCYIHCTRVRYPYCATRIWCR